MRIGRLVPSSSRRCPRQAAVAGIGGGQLGRPVHLHLPPTGEPDVLRAVPTLLRQSHDSPDVLAAPGHPHPRRLLVAAPQLPEEGGV
jgi:hypothetical protein